MKGIFKTIKSDYIEFSLKKIFYEKAAVFSAAHKLTEKYVVKIDEIDKDTVGVYIHPKKNINIAAEDLEQDGNFFCNEILDQQIRLDVEKAYGPIRELIVRQAFAPVSIKELSDNIVKDRFRQNK
ncbi:MAG: His-Xaa-Ser system protein HxsD [Candidatus Hodarchaeales archaeon]|jgi:His-Xaa-Ser system protein HxsD